jgi:hypothetical protein
VLAVIGYLLYTHRAQLGLGPSASNPESAGSDQAAEQQPAHVSWQSVDRTPDGFKVDMPADSSQFQVPAYNNRGGAEQVEYIQATPGSDTTFAIAWADDPPVERASGSSAERTLDTARDGALVRTQTTMLNESHTQFQGYAARNFSARNGSGGLFNARLILTGTRLYMLLATFPSSSARREADVNRFFDSFTLISPPRDR